MKLLPEPKKLLLLPEPKRLTRQEVMREKWRYFQLAIWKGGNVFYYEKFIELAEGKLDKADIRNFVLNRIWCERTWGTLRYKDFMEMA